MNILKIYPPGRMIRAFPFVVLLMLTALYSPSGQERLKPRPEILVSPQWLSQHLQDAKLRIIDLQDLDDFQKAHIPGAVHLSAGVLFATRGGVSGMLPPVESVARKLAQAGIGKNTVVVAYDNASGLYAARLFWALDYIGQGKGRVLDGGWEGWRRARFPVSAEIRIPPPARLSAAPRPAALADRPWMLAHIKHPGTLYVDARSTAEYDGSARHAKYGGHIPGAVSMEWSRHLGPDGMMRPARELRLAYAALGVTPDKEIAVYCQTMVRAAHSYFTLRWLGFPRVRGYDGSWMEWGNRDDTPKAVR